MFRSMVLLGIWLTAFAAVAQGPPESSEVEEAPAFVGGMVFDVSSGEPLGKARVGLWMNNSDGRPVYAASVVTDEEGRFSIENVGPGRYRIDITRPRYVTAPSTDRRLTRYGHIQIGEGAVLDDLLFGMTPTSVITGTVVDEDGEPFERIMVEALRLSNERESRGQTTQRSAFTDDRGQYRIFGLDPGKYYVRLNTAILKNRRRAFSEDDELSYVDLYYPSVQDVNQALPVEAAMNSEIVGVDFRMQKARRFSISGIVIDGRTGRPATGGYGAVLDGDAQGEQVNTPVVLRIDSAGRFRATGLRPGNYRLEAGGGRGRDGQAASFHDMTLSDQNVDGVTMTLEPHFSLEGSLEIEGDEPVDGFRRSPVSLRPDGPYRFRTTQAVDSGERTIRFEGLTTGLFRLVPSASTSFYLKSARYEGRDVLTEPVYIQPDGGRFSFTLSTNGGLVSGRALIGDEPASDAQVVLIPDDRQRRDRYRFVVTDQNGQYSISSVAPGGYKLFAWEYIRFNSWHRADVVAEVENDGERIDVEEKDVIEMNLELIERED